jgi:GDP-L-fucose synthase
MNKDSKIYIAGHLGMVGSAILRNLREKGFTNFILRDSPSLT